MSEQRFEAICETLKVAVAALRDADIQFLLGGSFAAWARGGPEPQNDLDFMVKPDDADAALAALEPVADRTERPPEEWLYKAWHGEVMIDLIFCPAGLELTEEVFDRGDWMPVLSVNTPVMALEDMLLTKLSALDEHSLDYSQLLRIARSLREQIDWPQLRLRAGGSPYAQAFFTLVQELELAQLPPQPRAGTRTGRVRVVPEG